MGIEADELMQIDAGDLAVVPFDVVRIETRGEFLEIVGPEGNVINACLSG